MRYAATAAVGLVLACAAHAGAAAAEEAGAGAAEGGAIELEIGPDTTVVEGPLRDDGTIDYAAAMNAMLSDGLAPEDNAFVEIAAITPPDEWPSAAHRARVFEMIGVDVPGADATYFVRLEAYAERQDEAGWTERVPDNDAPPRMVAPGVPAPQQAHEVRWELERRRTQEGPWSAEEAPLIAQWLADQQPALDRLQEAVRREAFWSPYVDPRFNDGNMLLEVLLP
ncbi:MAG: hypothetical protein WD009_07695 [Phycisphaeraceae bacterium]